MTNIQDTLDQFNAGIYMQQVEAALAETAKASLAYAKKGKPGKLSLTLTILPLETDENDEDEDFKRFNVEHAWSYEHPEKRGKSTRIHTTNTVMYISAAGELSILPPEEKLPANVMRMK